MSLHSDIIEKNEQIIKTHTHLGGKKAQQTLIILWTIYSIK